MKDFNKEKTKIKNKEKALKIISKGDFDLRDFSEKLLEDREFALAVLKKCYWMLKWFPKFIDDREFIISAVKANCSCFDCISDKFKDDEEIVMTAIKEKDYLFLKASPRLRNDIIFVLNAYSQKNDNNCTVDVIKYSNNNISENLVLKNKFLTEELVPLAQDPKNFANLHPKYFYEENKDFIKMTKYVVATKLKQLPRTEESKQYRQEIFEIVKKKFKDTEEDVLKREEELKEEQERIKKLKEEEEEKIDPVKKNFDKEIDDFFSDL